MEHVKGATTVRVVTADAKVVTHAKVVSLHVMEHGEVVIGATKDVTARVFHAIHLMHHIVIIVIPHVIHVLNVRVVIVVAT